MTATPATDTLAPIVLADPATPAIPGDPWASLEWMTQRAKLLEDQRQTLHRERDEARARVVDLTAEVARLRAHLAAAGLALDALTTPDAS